MRVGDPVAGGETDAGGEEAFAHAVGVFGVALVDRLAVHGLPEGAAFDVGGVEGHAQGFDVVVGLAVCYGGYGSVCHACLAAYGSGDYLLVGVLLTLDA